MIYEVVEEDRLVVIAAIGKSVWIAPADVLSRAVIHAARHDRVWRSRNLDLLTT